MQKYYAIKLWKENKWIAYLDLSDETWSYTDNPDYANKFYSFNPAKRVLELVLSKSNRHWYIDIHYEAEENDQSNDLINELEKENAELKEKCEKLKLRCNMAYGDVSRFTTETIALRKEVKGLRESNAILQSRLEEADADRCIMRTKLALKEAEVKAIADCFYDLQAQWSNLTTIDHVTFNDPATIVFWKDGTKTVVKNQEKRKKYDPEKGLAMAICKKLGGNKGSYYDEFKKWLPKK